jgi:hypothetical protein
MKQTFKISCAMSLILLGFAALLNSVFNESAFDTCLRDMTRDGDTVQHAVDACSQAEKQRGGVSADIRTRAGP